MPLVLAPSFDDHTREEVEAHLELVRAKRIAAALEYQQGKMFKLENEDHSLGNKLIRNYDALGKTLVRLDRELQKAEEYMQKCIMIRSEMELVADRIELAKR